MPTPQSIESARDALSIYAHIDDLDIALSGLQADIGQDAGDVAGIFFSKFDDPEGDWTKMNPEERINLLSRYLNAENIHADHGPLIDGPS